MFHSSKIGSNEFEVSGEIDNMPSPCHGKCRFEKKASKWTYITGKKMCTVCAKMMDSNLLRCFCCNNKLRIGAQENRYRQVRTANAPRIE